MQKLRVFQSLWAMELRRPSRPERSMEKNFQMVAQAGFDGICLDPNVAEIADMLKLAPLFEKYNLRCMLNVFPHELEDMPPLLRLANKLNACLVNVIGGVMPLTVAETVPVIKHWMGDASDAGLPLLFETHRDSTLNDLYFTLQVMDAVPEMRLCADLSHFVIDREMRLPLTARDAGFMQRVIERADCLQGRVASREQIQVQLDFAQHQPWVEQFRDWWRQGMVHWSARNSDDATLIFLCELGPPPYAITDGRGEELSDRWQEALSLMAWARKVWAQTGKAAAIP